MAIDAGERTVHVTEESKDSKSGCLVHVRDVRFIESLTLMLTKNLFSLIMTSF